MKKYIFLCLMTSILTIAACAQSNSHKEHECGEGIDMGVYPESYKILTENDWNVIQSKLNTFLECKNIHLSRHNGYSIDAWFTLMRMRDIEWTNHKTDAIIYLEKFSKKILAGESYLIQNNKNILYDDKGCLYGNGDPIKIPFASYSVVFKLDVGHGVGLVSDTWQSIVLEEPFSNSLRSNIINALQDYYRNDEVLSLISKIEKTKLTSEDIQIISEIKDKHEVYKINNQPRAWERLLVKLPNDLYGSGHTWQKNINTLKKVFGNMDINVPLKLAEQEKNFNKKYWLVYSCCGLVNGNYPNKVDNELIQRIDKLVNEVQREITPFKKDAKGEVDYLNVAYQALKKWHK